MSKQTGLLWYDEKQSLKTQLPKAVQRYHERLGGEPNVCYVSPQAYADAGEATVSGMLLRADAGISFHCFWLVHEVME